MSAKHWCFTINNPTALCVDGFMEWDLDEDTQYLVCQQEMSASGTPHIQGYISFFKKKRMSSVKNIVGTGAHVEVAKGTPAQNKAYCTKEESRLVGPWEYGTLPGGKGKRNDIADFVRDFKMRHSTSLPTDDSWIIDEWPSMLAKYPRFISNLRRVLCQPAREPFIARRGWQNDLSLVLSGPPSQREVLWYYEPSGNVGKSFFANNYRTPRGGFGYVVTGGRHSDIFYAYQYEEVVFFDWARDSEESFPYKVVESFKNGYFLNTKYESAPCRFTVPHVVVFANFEPDRSKLSQDRWNLNRIITL